MTLQLSPKQQQRANDMVLLVECAKIMDTLAGRRRMPEALRMGHRLLDFANRIKDDIENFDTGNHRTEIDYETLERMHKFEVWTSDQKHHFEAGWQSCEDAQK